jgi:hypothetical protein
MTERLGTTTIPAENRPSERTFILGYLAGVAVAYIVFSIIGMVWYATYISRYEWWFWSLLRMIAILPMWAIAAVPFTVVRRLVGAQGFSSAWRAMVSGAVAGLGTIPIGVWASRFLDFERGPPPFLPTLIDTIAFHSPFFAIAGACGGLVYWAIEFSSAPSAVAGFLSDARPLRWTGNLLSRRLVAASVGILMLALAIPTGAWWWRPHVDWSSATGVPRVAFASMWETNGSPAFLTWSPDSSKLVSLLLGTDGSVTVQNRDGGARQERRTVRPFIMLSVAGNDSVIVVPGNGSFASRTAFSVISVATGEILHEEPDPSAGARGLASAAVRLALSPDGSTLAVAYANPRAGQPISLYETRHWHHLSALIPLPDREKGVGAITFSPDGTKVAFGNWTNLVVVDIRTGNVVRSFPAAPSPDFAFSPDGSLMAANAYGALGPPSGAVSLRIFRIADGAEVASHPYPQTSISDRITWDPKGRFVAFRGVDGTIHLWNPFAAAGKDVIIGPPPQIMSFAVSPDGSRLAVGSEDPLGAGRVVSMFRID